MIPRPRPERGQVGECPRRTKQPRQPAVNRRGRCRQRCRAVAFSFGWRSGISSAFRADWDLARVACGRILALIQLTVVITGQDSFAVLNSLWAQGEMDFYNPNLKSEFYRVVNQVKSDHYASQLTLGIHDVIRAHFLIADFFITEQRELGGIGPRDIGLLESALHRAWIEYGGVSKWTDPLDKAATTLFGLIKDHPFYDANKRTALLATLFLLQKQGRMPQCSKNDFENLMVEIAEMEIIKRARYKKLTEAEDDPEVKYISQWLRRNTRKLDDKEYSITYRDLRRIIGKFKFILESPHNNMIDVVKVEKRSGLAALISGPERRWRIGRIGYPGDTKQVSKGDIRRLRRMCGLTSNEGVDSHAFYNEVDAMSSLIAEYQDNLRRLANR